MRRPDWLSEHPLIALVTVCVGLGLLLGWLTTGLPTKGSITNPQDSWTLPGPEVVSRFDDRAFQQLITSQAWAGMQSGRPTAGARGESGSDATGPLAWQLVGVVSTPELAALILPSGSAEVGRFQVGQVLPDGSHLTRIGKDWIEHSAEGCSYRRRLFVVSADKESADCSSNDKNSAVPSGQEK